MDPKTPGLLEHTLIHGSLPYQRKVFFQERETVLDVSHWTLWLILRYFMILYYLPLLIFQETIWWFHLFWCLKSDLTPQQSKMNNVIQGSGHGNHHIFKNLYEK